MNSSITVSPYSIAETVETGFSESYVAIIRLKPGVNESRY
jgi:hypothetical protein